MTEEKAKKKNHYEMEFSVKTDFGKITVLYDYREAWNAFQFDFRKYANSTVINGKEITNANSWQWCIGHAQETLKEIFPQVIFDALEQAYFEARARTVKELHDAPCFERQEAIEDGKKVVILNPIQPLRKYDQKSIIQFCKDVADKAFETSRKRMNLNKRGGSKHKIGGVYYASLDLYYDRFSVQSKSILKFYKWKKEQWKNELYTNDDEKWNNHFLEIMFQFHYSDVKNLRDKQAKAETKKERLKLEELDKAFHEILTIKDDEIERWKETFDKILAEDFSSQERITFDVLTPKNLTYHFLATAFNISAGTIENNLKELRIEKKRMVKEDN